MQFRLSTLLVFAAVSLVAICLVVDILRPPVYLPLTDDDIQRMSGSRYMIAYVNYHGDSFRQVTLEKDEYEIMRSLMLCLSPIQEVRPGNIENPDYALNYHGGMDPTEVTVKIAGDKLEFSLGNFVHSGGDSARFLSLLPDPRRRER